VFIYYRELEEDLQNKKNELEDSQIRLSESELELQSVRGIAHKL
jgi:hypothetical protein